MRLLKSVCIAFHILMCVNIASAEEIELINFATNTGECSAAQKSDLQKIALSETLKDFQTYSLSEINIERRRGASPPTGKKIRPLQTLMCLKKDGNKMLVTTVDPLDKSCGWVRSSDLKKVKSATSLLGVVDMAPCGDIKPMSIGEFCSTLPKLGTLSPTTEKLTQFCNIDGVKSSTIDAKFVTDNTTSRLYTQSESEQLVKREIPVYLKSDSAQTIGAVEIFSLNGIYDVGRTTNGELRILLGANGRLRGWVDLNSGHVWYSNLTTYFKKFGSEKVYLGEIIGSQTDSQEILAEKPNSNSFEVSSDYVKFPVLFDMRRRDANAPASFTPQLQIAFIGKFCDSSGEVRMCTDAENMYNKSLSNLRSADVAFLIDGSKSMREYFRIVAESLTNLTRDYEGNPDYRFGVAMYGDYQSAAKTNIGDPLDFRIVRRLKPIYTNDFSEISNVDLFIKDALKDKSEAVHAGVYEAAKQFGWEDGKPHFLIHIADHGDRVQPSNSVVAELKNQNIFYIPIAVEGEAILKESRDFVNQSNRYFQLHRDPLGNPMSVKAIVSYGDGNKAARDAISDALVEATNVVSIAEADRDYGSGTVILPTLSPAVKAIFNIPETDDIDSLAAVGNIKTASINQPEANWDYFVALERRELSDVKRLAADVCQNLGTGDSVKTATDAIITIVSKLTGDDKTPQELARQLREGSIPLQTQTIIGDGMTDFLQRSTTGEGIEEYKKEFCRTEILLDGMQRGTKIDNPEDGEGIVWNGSYYEAVEGRDFNWGFTDDLGREVFYLPINYMPRPL